MYDHRVYRLARSLSVCKFTALGILTAIKQLIPDPSGLTPQDVADVIGWQGEPVELSRGLQEAGIFCKPPTATRVLPGFEAMQELAGPNTNKPKPAKPAKPKKNPLATTPEFEEFWRYYPRKIAKTEAYPAYERAIARLIEMGDQAPHDTLLEAVRLHADAMVGTSLRFVPRPTTWLNQGRWTDVPEHTAAAVDRREAAPVNRRAEAMERMRVKFGGDKKTG